VREYGGYGVPLPWSHGTVSGGWLAHGARPFGAVRDNLN